MIKQGSSTSLQNINTIIEATYSTPNLSTWMLSPMHHHCLILFLSEILNISAETPAFTNFMNRNDISPQILTLLFFAALFSTIDIQPFFKLRKASNYLPIQGLIQKVQSYPMSLSGVFLSNHHVTQFLDYFLLNKNPQSRNLYYNLVQAVFSKPIQDTSSPDYQNLIIYLKNLISHDYLDAILKQIKDTFSVFTLSSQPTRFENLILPDYLFHIQNIVRPVFNPEISETISKLISKGLLECLKVCLDSNMYEIISRILTFISTVCDRSLFENMKISVYTDSLEICKKSIISNPELLKKLLLIIPDSKITDLFKSKFFEFYLMRTPCSILPTYLKKIDKTTAPVLAKTIWNVFEYDQKLIFIFKPEILSANYKLLTEYPSLADIFSKDYYLKYYQALQNALVLPEKNDYLRTICGILAAFLKGMNSLEKMFSKKAVIKMVEQLKKTTSLTELWQISLNKFKPTNIAPGGIIDLISIIITVDKASRDQIISTIPESYILHIQPDARPSAASLLATLSELSQDCQYAIQIGNEIQSTMETNESNLVNAKIIEPLTKEISRLITVTQPYDKIQPAIYNITQTFDSYINSSHKNNDLVAVIVEFTATIPEKDFNRNDNYAKVLSRIIGEEIRYCAHNPDLSSN